MKTFYPINIGKMNYAEFMHTNFWFLTITNTAFGFPVNQVDPEWATIELYTLCAN